MIINRRDAIKCGGKAVAVAAALPFLPSIAHAEGDAELFAQYEKCRRLERAYVDATEKADLASFAARGQFIVSLDGTLAEAEKQAGIPALYEKAKAAEAASMEAIADFYNIPAMTVRGTILKIQLAWSEEEVREFRAQAKGEADYYDFDDHVIGSILLDLERLSGRAV